MQQVIADYWSQEKPAAVVVIGDVDTTLAASQAANKQQLPLIHLEAGLRSDDSNMPEEQNRVVTDHLSDLLLITRSYARDRLHEEGITDQPIVLTGNVALDALSMISSGGTDQLDGDDSAPYWILTLHRAGNVDRADQLRTLPLFLRALSHRMSVDHIIFPVHPRTQQRLEELKLWREIQQIPGIRCLPPQSYIDFAKFMQGAQGVLTDSGGVLEESLHLNKPCVILRAKTEHQHALQRSGVLLCPFGSAMERMDQVIDTLSQPAGSNPNYRESRASRKAAETIANFMNRRFEQAEAVWYDQE
jgi:UDP-N-acetylglucosamine 2-epimerase (non-hydrolysing)